MRHVAHLRKIHPGSLLLLSAMTFLLGCGYLRFPYSTVQSDFSISVTPATVSVVAGSPATAYGFTVSPIGSFNGPVTISIQPPQGLTCVPVTCSALLPTYASSNALQLATSATTPAGTYPLQFVATSGSLSHTATATLVVLPATSPDFSFTVTPTQSVTASGIAAQPYSFVATPINGFTGSINVSAAIPSGFTCAPVSCTATLTGNQAANALQLTPSATTTGTFTLNFTATSGNISHTASASLTVQQQDFTFSVSPTTSTATAGSPAPPYSFSITPVNGFSGTVSIATTLPNGFICVPAACTATVTDTETLNAIQLTPPATASGSYNIVFTATSGALSHTATAVLNITAAPPPPATEACAVAAPVTPPSTSRQAFVYTGDATPSSVIYDKARNRVLVTDLQHNEIDVISPDTLSITARLPVPQPTGIDLSVDGKTLYIGTRTHYMYLATADTLCIKDRAYTVGVSPYTSLSPQFPTALADGSVIVAAYDVYSTADEVLLWTADAGFTWLDNLGEVSYSVRNIIPSGDRMHAYLSGDDSGGVYARYDVGGKVAFKTVAFGSQPYMLAVNQDGSRVLFADDCCSVVLADGDFNTIASTSFSFAGHAAAEPDFSKFYLSTEIGLGITVLDGTLKPIGSLPTSIPSVYYSPQGLGPFDGMHRIVALSDTGVSFLPVSPIAPVQQAGTSPPTLATPGAVYGTFQPEDPENGLTTTLNGGNFPASPSSVVLSEGASTQSATVNSYASNVVHVTVPNFSAGCADVTATFPTGPDAFAPQAFCYSPAVFVVDGDSGPTAGGLTITLYGMGFGSTPPKVTIGGVASPHVTLTAGYGSSGAVTLSTLKVEVPPGTSGDADLSVITSWQSTTLPRAFHYVQRSDTALPSGANPNQLILDSQRSRILVTDSAHNQLLVYSLNSGTLLNSIPTGPTPQGIGLTPDGSKLVLLTAGDYKVSVLDADTYSLLQQVTSSSSDKNLFGTGPVGPPIMVATMTGNKAYIATQPGYLQGPAADYSYSMLYDFDLTANTLSADPVNTTYYGGGEPFYIASSLDGSTAMIGGEIGTTVGGPLIAPDTILPTFYDPSVAPDGQSVSNGVVLLDSSAHWQNSLTADLQIQDSSALGETFFYGAQFNGSGSLFYRATSSHIRIYDVKHGNLLRTLEVPGGLIGSNGSQTTSPTRLLAVDPVGQQVVAATANGVSIFTFASDPLSISEANNQSGQLTLLGSGFFNATSITVDTLAASATYVSSTQLSVTLPVLAAGPHSVTATNPNGDAYTLTLAFSTP